MPDDHESRWKLEGEERHGKSEDELRKGVLSSKSIAELKTVLSKYQDIIHRDTDYKVQNIMHMVKEFEMKRASLADMPVQYGIKSKMTELVSKDRRFK